MRILIDGQTFQTPEIHRGIGVYIKNTINQMVKISCAIDWFIAVSDPKNLKELDPWVRSRLHVIVSDEFIPGTDYGRNLAYTEKTQEIIRREQIDAVWIPNGLMVNVLFLSHSLTCPVFVTVYDLIPYIFPVKEWPKNITEEYQRRLQLLKDQDNIRLLMISEATRQDWIHYMDDNRSESTVTFLSADAKIFYHKRIKNKKTGDNPYILFTGGFDYRKNIDGAISAFAKARKEHCDDPEFLKYKLIIVGKYDEQTKQKYERFIASQKVTENVRLTGYISDEELAKLYQQADIFFFPSLYEGFGLPILEAMLGGAYIVSANNSSLPEVCSGYATLFDVDDSGQMSEALYTGYCNSKNETQEDIDRRQEYALGFSWDHTAKLTLEMIEQSVTEEVIPDEKPSLAVFTPWPDQETGIANYESKMIPYLSKYFDITVFTGAPARKEANAATRVCPLKAFVSEKNRFTYRLFQIGNNVSFHKDIFEMLEREGGIAEIHDYVLSPFFFSAYGKDSKRFEKLLIAGYGEEKGKGFAEIARRIHNHPDIGICPMSETVVALSDKTIFHNQWSRDKMQGKNVYTIPHPSFPMEEPDPETQSRCRSKYINKYDISESDTLISCFGWVNRNKRPDIVLDAIKRLKSNGYKVKMVFWGENNEDYLWGSIKDRGLDEQVFVSGYLSREEYYTALEMTDIVVNLRYPSMGEASGTLCEAFQMGKPTIVSDLNQYQEYPDEVCWKLPVCNSEDELLSVYIAYLIDHPEVADALGKNARAYAKYTLDPERIARLYYQCITREGCS